MRPAGEADFKKLPVLCQGFYDSHMHPSWMAKLPSQINCRGLSLKEIIAEIHSFPEDIVYGYAWDEKSLQASVEEMQKSLDEIKKHIVLFRICGHVAYVSKEGFLKEKELEKIPRPPLNERGFKKVLEELQSAGIDEWADLLVRKEDFGILHRHGGLLFGNVKDFPYFSTSPQKPRYIKYFLDGSLGARTAWLSKPYTDHPSFGIQTWSDEELFKSMQTSLTEKFLLAFHAIGDAALDQLLRVSKKLLPQLQARCSDGFFHRIEHLQVCRDDQIEEIKKQGVWSLGLQPSHRIADAGFVEERLGMKRLLSNGYRLKSFLDAGLRVSFGSDTPIVSFLPEKTFEAVESDPRPEERISLAETYKIFCVSGRQNAGISAKKLLKNSKLWISTSSL